jgi:hypothetical protein
VDAEHLSLPAVILAESFDRGNAIGERFGSRQGSEARWRRPRSKEPAGTDGVDVVGGR